MHTSTVKSTAIQSAPTITLRVASPIAMLRYCVNFSQWVLSVNPVMHSNLINDVKAIQSAPTIISSNHQCFKSLILDDHSLAYAHIQSFPQSEFTLSASSHVSPHIVSPHIVSLLSCQPPYCQPLYCQPLILSASNIVSPHIVSLQFTNLTTLRL